MEKQIVPVNPVSREILTYLSKLPHKLKNQGDSAAADVALALGNCLCWIAPWVAPGESKIEQPIEETAQTVHALGKQFRAVALAFMDKPGFQAGKDHAQIALLDSRIDDLNARLGRWERAQSMANIGGAK